MMATYGDVRVDIEPFPNVTHVLDAHHLPSEWTGRFSKIVCYITLEHLDSPIVAIGQMAKVLTDDGTIEIVVPNIFHWRRILKSYHPEIKKWKMDADLPDHKQAWDLVEMRNLANLVGLTVVSIDFLDWLEGSKLIARNWKWRLLDKYLPKMFTTSEVKYVLRRKGV